MEILLSSPKLVIKQIKVKTAAILFKDMKQGDIIQFSTIMRSQSYNLQRRPYSIYIKISNLTQGTSDDTRSQTHVCDVLESCFELEEVQE